MKKDDQTVLKMILPSAGELEMKNKTMIQKKKIHLIHLPLYLIRQPYQGNPAFMLVGDVLPLARQPKGQQRGIVSARKVRRPLQRRIERYYVVYGELKRLLNSSEQVWSVSVHGFFCQCEASLNSNLRANAGIA